MEEEILQLVHTKTRVDWENNDRQRDKQKERDEEIEKGTKLSKKKFLLNKGPILGHKSRLS